MLFDEVALLCFGCVIIALTLVAVGYVLFESDIPFWVDYWVTNGGR